MTFNPIDRTSQTLISGPAAVPQAELEALPPATIVNLNLNLQIDGSMSNDRLRNLLRIIGQELKSFSMNPDTEGLQQPEPEQKFSTKTPDVE